MSQQQDINKIYLYAKDPCQTKYQFLINKREVQTLSIYIILKLLLNTQMI